MSDNIPDNKPVSQQDDAPEAEVGLFSNCCNGKVGADALAAVLKDPSLRDLVTPNGVRILTAGGIAEVSNSTNCCNGKVGSDKTM